MTDNDDDAPEWSADVFARAEIRRGGEVVREASGTLTKPHESMLERAARALCADDDCNPEWFHADDDTETPLWTKYVSGVRAVLMAVREPDKSMIDAGIVTDEQPSEGQESDLRANYAAMIDAILNEPQS